MCKRGFCKTKPSESLLLCVSIFHFFQGSKSNFHQLLMTLAVVDCGLILFYILDSYIVGIMETMPLWYKVAFPHFLHPVKAITLSLSIFMVVAISAER